MPAATLADTHPSAPPEAAGLPSAKQERAERWDSAQTYAAFAAQQTVSCREHGGSGGCPTCATLHGLAERSLALAQELSEVAA